MPTNNPLPSSSLEDFKDNSIILDHFVNSQEEQHPDRFGRARPTITGIIREAFNVRTDISNMNDFLIGLPRWDEVPKNTSLTLGGDNGALNKQAQALFNRTLILKTNVREALRKIFQETGLNLVEGSFEQGGTLTNPTDVLLEEKTGKVYSWNDVFPKTVSGNTLPSSDVNWVDQSNARAGSMVNIKVFGIIGNGVIDETDKVQLAFNTVSSIGGGTLYIPANMKIKCTGLIYGRPKVSIKCEPTSDLVFKGASWLTPTNNLALLGYYGSAGAPITPSGDMVAGSNKINVQDTSLFKIGDMIELSMDSNGKWIDTSVVVTSGQLAIVTAIYPVTGNIVISEPIYETLTLSNSAKIRIITPIEDVVIDGLGIIGNGRNPTGNAEQGLKIFFGRNVEIKNCRIKDADTQSIGVISCYGAQIHNNEIIHPALGDIDVISYSIAYSSSMHVKIYNNKSINSRHGIISSHLARSYGYYGINRFIDIYDNTHTSNYGDLGSAGFPRSHGGIATHTDSEFINIYDNTIIGCRYGINVRTPNNIVRNNKIYDCPVGVYLSEYWGDIEVVGNTLYNCTIPFSTDSTPYEVPRGIIDISDNKIAFSGGSRLTFPTTVKSTLLFMNNKYSDPVNTDATASISIYNNVDFTAEGNNFVVNDTMAIRDAATDGVQLIINNRIRSNIPFVSNSSIYVVSANKFEIKENTIVSPAGTTLGGIACPTRLAAPYSVVTNNNIIEG